MQTAERPNLGGVRKGRWRQTFQRTTNISCVQLGIHQLFEKSFFYLASIVSSMLPCLVEEVKSFWVL